MHSFDEVFYGTFAHAGRAVDPVWSGAEGQGRGEKAGDGSGVADENVYGAGWDLAPATFDLDEARCPVGLYVEAQVDQGLHQPERVVGEERVSDGRGSVGQGGQDQGPVRYAFGAGYADRSVYRTVQGL